MEEDEKGEKKGGNGTDGREGVKIMDFNIYLGI